MPKVSVILPVYNVEKYIEKSIHSILNQTLVDFELLVIIDGSPDRSEEIARSFCDPRINVLVKPNGGLSDARNFGLVHSKGEFIYFMDSDDWVSPRLLQENVFILESTGTELVVFGYYQDTEDLEGNLLQQVEISPKAGGIKRGQPFPIDEKTLGLLGYAWNKVYRRQVLFDNGLQYEKGTSLIEDILFNINVYLKIGSLSFNPDCYYHYIDRPVTTLMKTFHADLFLLKKRKTIALIPFFNEWNVLESDAILASCQIQGIRYCVHNLFTFKNQLSFLEKITYLKQMLNDPITIEYIDKYIPKTKKDRLYKLLIESKSAFLIGLLASISK